MITGANKWSSFREHLCSQILEDITQYSKYANRKTGFANLDAQHKFFAPGLYILGGVSGMGKTTFVWQLCEQLAKQGEFIAYVSYEMSQLDLLSKSISRRLREKIISGEVPSNQQLSSMEFKSGLSNLSTTQILKELDKEHLPISIYSANETDTVEKILQQLAHKISEWKVAPVVVIDYLQIIPHQENNSKLGIDKIVTKLKNFQRDTNTTFILISSISRAFYGKSLTFAALKESGGIEYSADVIWGMQFSPKSSRDDHQQIPRTIQIVTLKNRMGNEYVVTFDYYPDSDLFVDPDTWNW